MPFQVKGDALSFDASLEDMKLVYRTLHRYLADHLELMDCTFFEELQTALQRRAQEQGVDVGHHGAWDLWLGNTDATPCEERVKKRRTL